VHLLLVSNQIPIQSPTQFCSSQIVPNPLLEEFAKLSTLDLGAPLSSEVDVNDTTEDPEMPPHTDPDAASSRNFDLNFTTEEYKQIVKKQKKTKFT